MLSGELVLGVLAVSPAYGSCHTGNLIQRIGMGAPLFTLKMRLFQAAEGQVSLQ